MPIRKPYFSADETIDRAEVIYNTSLRDQVETGNRGRYIAIDIETHEH